MSNLVIRPVDLSEIDLLRQIAIDTYQSSFARYNTERNNHLYINKAFNLSTLLEALQNPSCFFFFALVDNEVVGYLRLNTESSQTEDLFENSLEIERIYFLPSFAGKGYGQTLLDFAISYARQLKIQDVWLGVWEHNPRALRFYERNGFIRFGDHPYMMGEEEQTDYLMRLEKF